MTKKSSKGRDTEKASGHGETPGEAEAPPVEKAAADPTEKAEGDRKGSARRKGKTAGRRRARAAASGAEPAEPAATASPPESASDAEPPSRGKSRPRRSSGGRSSGTKTSLPAFGFADDLLEKSAVPAVDGMGTEAADSKAGDRPTVDVEAVDVEAVDVEAVDAGAVDAAAEAVDGIAPTRIFDFADRLLESEDEESDAVPARLGTFVTFGLAGETFAMPVQPVRQVVRVTSITRVPHAPRPIRGVTNLRGKVIPVIDLRLRVGLTTAEADRSARIIAVGSRGRVLGLLVDAVYHVMHLDLNLVQPPPDDVMTIQSDYIRGVYGKEDDLILLLDVDRALIIREEGAA